MNDKQLDALRRIGGDEFVEAITAAGEQTTKALEEIVDYKSTEGQEQEEGEKAGFADRIRKVVARIKDAKLKDRVEKFCAKLEKQAPYPYPKPKAKKADDEHPESVKADDEYPKPEKADSALGKLGKELRLISGQVGGAEGKELRKIADEMLKAAGEKTSEGCEEEEKKDSPPDVLTRKEVVDGFEALIGLMREETARSQEATVESITKAIAPLAEAVKALQVSDAEKVAAVAEVTPAASIADLVRQAAAGEAGEEHRKELTKKSSELWKSGPAETEPGPRRKPTGLFIDSFITSADQQQRSE